MKVECLKLSDGCISVMIDEDEVVMLPKKKDATLQKLEDAVKQIVAYAVEITEEECRLELTTDDWD